MSVKKTLINSIWFGVIPKISTLVNVILLPILTPYLTSEDLGIWGIISGYVGIFSSVASLGLYVHLTNSYYEYGNRYHHVWSRLLFLILLVSFLCSLVLFAVLAVSLDGLPLGIRIIVSELATFPVLFSGNTLLAQHLYPLLGKPKPLVLRNLSASLSGIATAFIFIYILKLGYLGYVFGAAVNALVGFLLFIHPLWIKNKIKPIIFKNKQRIISLLKISFPAIPHALGFIFLSSSARIIMDIYNVPIGDIGLYTNGYIIGDYISIITTAIIISLSPQIQMAYRSGNFCKYRSLYYFCQCISLAVILIFVIWMPELYDLLINNEELKQSIVISQYSCFANAVFPFYTFMATICFIEKRTDHLLWLVFVPGVLNVILCAIFIPILGYKAALATTIISYWAQLFIPFFVRFHKDKTKMWFGNLKKVWALLTLLIGALLISTYLSNMGLISKICVTIIVGAILYVYLKYCAKENVV